MRTVDELGRVVIPANLRRKLNIKPHDELEFVKQGSSIVMKKVNDSLDMRELLEKFVLWKFGGMYRDILISKIDIQEVEQMMYKYFCNKLVE